MLYSKVVVNMFIYATRLLATQIKNIPEQNLPKKL